jgi:hypothetical protein
MTVDARSETVLAGPVVARIHALWDELADFGAHETDAAPGARDARAEQSREVTRLTA